MKHLKHQVFKGGFTPLDSKHLTGFTLIELIVTIAIISSITVISVISVGNFLSQARLKSSARDIASTLRWARRAAITRRIEHRVVFDPWARHYRVEDKDGNVMEKGGKLARNIIFANPHLGKWEEEDGLVEFDDPDDNSISFYPQGTAETGSIYLQDEQNKEWHTITITGTTGYARIYPEKH